MNRKNAGSLLIGALIAMVVAGTITAAAVDADELHRSQAEAAAYCELTYGSDALVQANAIGSHGGWHCLANKDDRPHLHEVPSWARELAYQVKHGDAEVDWNSVERQVQHQYDARPWHTKGMWPMAKTFVSILGIAFVLGASIRHAPGRLG